MSDAPAPAPAACSPTDAAEPTPVEPVATTWRPREVLVRALIPAFVALGATAKVLYGSPFELPPFVLYLGLQARLSEEQTFLLIVGVEYVLAAVMLLHARWATWVARGTLMLFIAVLLIHQADTLVRNISGASCGCFGAIHIPVGLMLAIEGLLLLATFLLPGRRHTAEFPPLPGNARFALMTAIAAVGIGFAAGAFRYNYIGGLRAPEDVVELDLLRNARGNDWDRLKIARYLDKSPKDFAEPVQYWVLWRTTCPICHQVFKEQFSTPQPGVRVIAVEIPPFPPLPPNPDPFATQNQPIECAECVRLTMPADRDWKIRTPIILRVEGGRVSQVERRME
ncbi:MAG: hypothetical protein LW650_02950 [Planctomycetaceae bacterium]|jgi:hypothetical protein|nr:hypothetical protein [Phycisphaerales bacterium]MCE2652476.1 hypothetical protein [Planctomycetaceae bacterium]